MMTYTTRELYTVRISPETVEALEKLAARLDITTWGGHGDVSALLDRLAERWDSDPDAVVDLLRYRSRGKMADYAPEEAK
jgi:hypothetical protein